MAGEKTYAELITQIDAGIRVNGNKEITPTIHNAIEAALANSLVNKKEAGLVLQALLGYTTELTPSDNKHLTPKKYVDDLGAARWNIAGNTLAARGTFGNIGATPYGLDIKVDTSTVIGGWGNDGKLFWGTTASFADTSFSLKSFGTGAGSFAINIKDSLDTNIIRFRDDGFIFCSSIGNMSGYGFDFSLGTLNNSSGGVVLKLIRQLIANGDVPTLDWESRALKTDWIFEGSLLGDSPSKGLGYKTGAGGTVTQLTSKTTGVTLNKIAGQITTHNENMGQHDIKVFVVSNTTVSDKDTIIFSHVSGGTTGDYGFEACGLVDATSFSVAIKKYSGGTSGDALVFNYTIIKGANA